MGSFLRSFIVSLMMLLNIVVAIFFLACSFAPYMHPEDWWFTGFFGLFFPYLFVVMLFFLFFWIVVKIQFSFFPLIVLLAGLGKAGLHFPVRTSSDFIQDKSSASIRIMTWNIRHFIPFDESNFKPDQMLHQAAIFEQVRKYNPDIICFQEFLSIPEAGSFDPVRVLEKDLGYKFHQFAGTDIFKTKQYSGIAIFSKLPIVSGGVIPYPDHSGGNAENTAYADVVVAEDTVRIYSVHLQSFGFGSREYKRIDDVKAKLDSSMLESKHLLRKMRNTFYWHGIQSDFFERQVDEAPYPSIVVGDLNDVPGSYTYSVVRGDRKDAFLEKGIGLGSTFTSSSSSILRLLPTLRIDYIFHPQEYETIQFIKGANQISDHRFLLADLKLN
jgi:endonuclease/exonuclease/phosphatase family metal-dependent hydrolase